MSQIEEHDDTALYFSNNFKERTSPAVKRHFMKLAVISWATDFIVLFWHGRQHLCSRKNQIACLATARLRRLLPVLKAAHGSRVEGRSLSPPLNKSERQF